MRDEALPDNCTGQDFADKVNILIRDYNPYIQMPYTPARGLNDSSSSSCRQRWQAKDAHFYAN
eukprot:5340534-Pleurochrysis_carterae.AAC.1